MPKFSLIKKAVEGSIASTTTKNGHRTRKTCGFLFPQIPSIGLLHLFNAEFVARSIRRTKAEFFRTNKASRFFAVVEALPPLLQVGKSNLLNKEKSKMLFKFLCVNRTKAHFHLCVVPVESSSETQARLRLSADFRYLATIAKINRTFLKGGVYGRG